MPRTNKPPPPAHPPSPNSRIAVIKTNSRQGTGVRLGGGVGKSGHLVLTCQHVIGGATVPPLIDGQPCLRVIASDPHADLALLEEAAPPLLPEAEWWDEEIALDAALRIEGFPGGKYDCLVTRLRATHAGPDRGVTSLELPGNARAGMSGGLAVLHADPFACIGLVQLGGDDVFFSSLIGVGAIRAFLAAHHPLKIRGGEESRQVEQYLRLLRADTGFIDIRALKIESGGAHNIPIEELYIPLDGGMPDQRPDKQPGGGPPPLESALQFQRVLIQGEAGSGKSTFLKRVAYELAGGAPGQFPAPLPAAGLFPLYLKIAQLEKHIAECFKKSVPSAPTIPDHPDWLAHCLEAARSLPRSFFRRKLDRPDTVVLLDGLDESPTPATRLATMQLIERMAAAHPLCRFVVTTRPRAGVQLHGFQPVRIEPLSTAAREKFLGDWTRFLFRGRAPEAAAAKRQEMLAALSARPEINRMAGNPLMLTALAALSWNKRRLPEQRALLYESVLVWLAESRPDRQINATDCLDYFGELAYAMQTLPAGSRESIEKEEAAPLIHSLDRKTALAFLDREEVDSGIVVSQDRSIRFWHLTFQEFLAARFLNGAPGDPAAELLRDGRLYLSEWREVVRLYAGLLSKRQAQAFIARILDLSHQGSLVERAHCAALLAAIAADLRPDNFQIADPRYHRPLLASLVELFQPPAPGVPQPDLAVRVAAAEAMESLDPHPLLRLPTDEDYWAAIPGGTYTLGAQKDHPSRPNFDTGALPDEPVHTAHLKPFRFGRHPVTVHEFSRYVEAAGDLPGDWDAQLHHPSRPVVNVSWRQAVAYCQWIGIARLPSEDEWEAAARGTAARKYPWGDQPEPAPHLANYNMNVGAPSPVGLFPLDMTPNGVADMAGNVWEWTAERAVRGGAFNYVATGLRAANRYDRFDPGYRFYFLGFRLVRE